jgi:hypothetical protein
VQVLLRGVTDGKTRWISRRERENLKGNSNASRSRKRQLAKRYISYWSRSRECRSHNKALLERDRQS